MLSKSTKDYQLANNMQTTVCELGQSHVQCHALTNPKAINRKSSWVRGCTFYQFRKYALLIYRLVADQNRVTLTVWVIEQTFMMKSSVLHIFNTEYITFCMLVTVSICSSSEGGLYCHTDLASFPLSRPSLIFRNISYT